jgi:HD superfamily phosphodiesterase
VKSFYIHEIVSDLYQNISAVESRWLITTKKYIASLFSSIGLPSHDHLHHLRVWSFAKQLVSSAAKKYEIDTSINYIEALFFACLFHDTGMIKTISEDHGSASIEFAQDFLRNQSGYNNLFTEEAMRAIALHDDKTYYNIRKSPVPGIYEFLTIADDLDAFGALGLMRYLEIYIRRSIDIKDIKQKINQNIKSRYDFLVSFLSVDHTLFKEHNQRYMLSVSYLNRLTRKDLETIYHFIMQGHFLPDEKIILQNPVIYDLITLAKNEGDIYH